MPPQSELYDAHAAELYRYCWTLVGPGAASGAVREALMAASCLSGELPDADDRRPWLFALARAACRHAGFAAGPPFADVPAAEDERPARAMWSRLPPSYRELLELHRRHGLTAGQISKILGLDAETCAELCRAAERRAADLLAEALEEAGRAGEAPATGAALEALEPPGPPSELRPETVRACTAPSGRIEREEAAELMRPLGHDGFPLHRRRGPHTAPAPEPPGPRGPGDPGDPGPGEARGTAPAAPRDRITTADVPRPARPEEDGPAADPRWPGAAVSGLATVAVAVLLSATAFLLNEPGTMITDTAPPAADAGTPVAGDQRASDSVRLRPERIPSAAPEDTGAPPPSAQEPPGGTPAPSPSAPPREPEPSAPPAEPPGTAPPGTAPPGDGPPSPSPPEETSAPDPPPEDGDPVTRFFEGLADLLSP